MFLVPYDRLVLHTTKAPDEVIERISANVDTSGLRSVFLWGYSSRKYLGRATRSGFLMSRPLNKSPYPKPFVNVVVMRSGSGSDVSLLVFDPTFVVFLVIAYLIVASYTTQKTLHLLTLLALYIFFWLLHRLEKTNTLSDIREMLSGDISQG